MRQKVTEVFIEMGIGDEEQNTGADNGAAVAPENIQDQASSVKPTRVDVGGVNIETAFNSQEVDHAMHDGLCKDLSHWRREDQLKRSRVIGAIVPLTGEEKEELVERVNSCRHEVSPVQKSDPLVKRSGAA